jgi:GDP/UDP-N,N'-diacetylbacillosamine 2-epimerase (hydrolysing)
MLLSSDTPTAITKSIGLGMISFADAYRELEPNLLLLLGDRFEIFAAASAGLIARIPIAHIHGGESTEGAIDEAIRHSITKMAHLHFVAAEEYRQRVIQLGENPRRVFCVGGLGVDNITHLKLLSRNELEAAIDFKLFSRNLLITFHPVTLENNSSKNQIDQLLKALQQFNDVGLIFTMPNADAGGRNLFKKIKAFCDLHPNAKAFTSLGQLRYLSCLNNVDGVVGNSSSGLCEAPSFKKATINIGDRQRGRLKAGSVIDCDPTTISILNAINQSFLPDFTDKLAAIKNPYGDGGASAAIVKKISKISLDNLLKKAFFDINNLNSFL